MPRRSCTPALRPSRGLSDAARGALIFGLAALASCATGSGDPRDLLRSPDGDWPGEIAGWRVQDPVAGEAVHFLFRREGADPVEVRLSPRDDALPAWERLGSTDVRFLGPRQGEAPAPEMRPLADEVLARLRANGADRFAFHRASEYAESPDAPAGPARAVDRAALLAGFALVGLFLLLSPLTATWTWRDARAPLGPRATWALAAILLVGLALRLALPHLPVMHYMGYRMVQLAAGLDEVPKYGPGSLVLYHLVFQATNPSHQVMAMVNSFLGAGVPLGAAALLARTGAGAPVVLAGAATLALVPLFVKDATTESLGVPAMAWTFLGLALLARARTTRSPVALGLALVHLLLAAFSRPEAVGLVPLAAAAAWWPVAPGRGPSTADPALQRSIRPALLALAAALLVLRAIQMALAVDVELARGNTPDLVTVEGLRAMVSGLAFRNAAFWPTFFPLVATGLALLGPAVTTGRARVQAAAFLALAILGLAVSQLDLPYVSVPRVQAPALAFLALAAAWGFGGLWAFQRRAFARPRAFAALVAVEAAVVVASCAATVPALWAPTNADDEERLFRDALAALPDEPVTLVRRGYEDPPREPGHLYNPDYLFRPPRRDDRVIGPDRFLRDAPTDRPAYFLLGTRCWLRACGSEGMHPACAGMARRFRLEPVFERDVPVRRLPLDRPPAHPLADLDFGWCTPADAMRIGLYRVLPAGD